MHMCACISDATVFYLDYGHMVTEHQAYLTFASFLRAFFQELLSYEEVLF